MRPNTEQIPGSTPSWNFANYFYEGFSPRLEKDNATYRFVSVLPVARDPLAGFLSKGDIIDRNWSGLSEVLIEYGLLVLGDEEVRPKGSDQPDETVRPLYAREGLGLLPERLIMSVLMERPDYFARGDGMVPNKMNPSDAQQVVADTYGKIMTTFLQEGWVPDRLITR